MPMPKATVDKDDEAVPRKDKVGSAGQIFAVESKSQAEAMSQAAHNHFGPGVFTADLGHIGAAALGADTIHLAHK